MRIAFVFVCVSCFIGACASASRPAATAAGQGSPSGSAASAPEASSQNDAPKPNIESQRESFIHACMEKAHLADYCSCGFDQFREVFKDADLTKAIEPGDARVKALQERTVAQCASKLTDEQVKANFIEGCEGGDRRKAKYCACAWPALRKQLSLADFIGDADSPRFTQAKQAILVSCKGKFPAEVAKSDFMSGCTKDHPERDKMCVCLWKKVTAKYSVDEIANGAIDVNSTPGLSECQK
jgi:hypothetical protein